MRAVWNNVSSFLPSPKPPNLKNLHILSIISDTNLAHLNPLRYRGYVYDNETVDYLKGNIRKPVYKQWDKILTTKEKRLSE